MVEQTNPTVKYFWVTGNRDVEQSLGAGRACGDFKSGDKYPRDAVQKCLDNHIAVYIAVEENGQVVSEEVFDINGKYFKRETFVAH